MSRLWNAALFTLALVLGASQDAQADGLMDARTALTALRSGPLNIYMRHAITDRSQRDTGRLGDRAGQRNLSEAGRAQASALGRGLRALDIRVSAVWASPVYRARDTADLAFGADRVRILAPLVADDYTTGDASADAAEIRRKLADVPEGGHAIYVGHIVPLGLILRRSFSQEAFPEGSLALVRPQGQGFTFLGVVTAEALIEAAASAQRPPD
jgi:phosphohistidine phosphatase SixA